MKCLNCGVIFQRQKPTSRRRGPSSRSPFYCSYRCQSWTRRIMALSSMCQYLGAGSKRLRQIAERSVKAIHHL